MSGLSLAPTAPVTPSALPVVSDSFSSSTPFPVAGVSPPLPLSPFSGAEASVAKLRDAGASGAALAAAVQFFITAQCLLDEPWPKQASLHNRTCFDFIVVGGGTAGSIMASRLAEESKFRVLLIEAGPDPPKESIIPGFRNSLIGSPYDWNMTTVGDPDGASQALTGGSQSQPRGKMLGGTGSLNDMVYSRGYPADYDEWATTLGAEWSWKSVLTAFMKTEHITDENIINDPELMRYHGRSGPIDVSGYNASTFDTDMFLRSFKEIGFKRIKDMANPSSVGAGRHSHTINNGRRASAVTALLNEAAVKSNLFVLKEALVTKILIENQTAYGVKVLYKNEELQFYAKKEVVLSAGVFNTPKLLMLSGIGPEEHLKEFDIEVIKNLPVGENLHDHVMVLNYIQADNGTCYTDEGTSHMSMIKYLYDKTGPYSFINTMAAYKTLINSTNPHVPDFAFYPSCMPMGTKFYESCVRVLRLKSDICISLEDILKEHELITIAIVLLKPQSRGRVKLRSANPLDDPLIFPGTFNNMDDLKDYPEAIEIVQKIAESSYFKQMNAQVVDLKIDVCKGLLGDDKVRCKAKAMAMSAWHSVGTAAMGSIVDSRLKVNGIEDLRVVDSSVMPKVIRGNTNAPVIMIAEKAADFIKADYKTCT